MQCIRQVTTEACKFPRVFRNTQRLSTQLFFNSINCVYVYYVLMCR